MAPTRPNKDHAAIALAPAFMAKVAFNMLIDTVTGAKSPREPENHHPNGLSRRRRAREASLGASRSATASLRSSSRSRRGGCRPGAIPSVGVVGHRGERDRLWRTILGHDAPSSEVAEGDFIIQEKALCDGRHFVASRSRALSVVQVGFGHVRILHFLKSTTRVGIRWPFFLVSPLHVIQWAPTTRPRAGRSGGPRGRRYREGGHARRRL